MSNFLTFVALQNGGRLSGDALLNSLGRMTPGGADAAIHQAPGGENALLLEIGGVTLTVMVMDFPLPEDEYRDALELERVWPEAGQALKSSRAHVVVAALNDASSHEEALKTAALVTAVAAAVTECLPALAVIWTEARRILSPDDIEKAAAAALAGQPPVFYWVNLIFLRGQDTPGGQPTIAVLTIGLAPFIGWEIEFLPAALPPGEVAGRVMALASYLLNEGPVVRDGETVGLTEDEKIHVRFADEGQRPGVPVMQLSMRT